MSSCSARALSAYRAVFAARQRGLSVVLVDRRELGSEISYGNAGVLSNSGSILPLNKPSLWSALPGYLGNTGAALRWDPLWAMRNLDWIARFLGNAVPIAYLLRATALHGLIGSSLKLHREWIVKAGAGNRIRETGWLKAWRSDATDVASVRFPRRVRHQERTARPSGDLCVGAEFPGRFTRRASCIRRPPRSIYPARWSRPMPWTLRW